MVSVTLRPGDCGMRAKLLLSVWSSLFPIVYIYIFLIIHNCNKSHKSEQVSTPGAQVPTVLHL